MSPWIFVDDYNIVDLSYLVQAFPLNPCAAHPTDPEEWLIAVLLHVGKAKHCTTMSYPTRALRDDAFEAIGQRVRVETPAPVQPGRADDDGAL